MAAITVSVASAAGWRSFVPAAFDSADLAAPVLTRDRAFTAFADAIAGALALPAAPAASDAAATADSRVGDAALALRSALVAAGDSAGAVPDLLDKVAAALAAASRALGGAGFDRTAIQSFLFEFRTALSDRLSALASEAESPPAAPAMAAAPAPATSVTATAAPDAPQAAPVVPTTAPVATSGGVASQYRLTEKGVIELVTTDGDVVRIGFRESAGASVAGASAAGAAGLAAYASVASYASSRFVVSVQGSLNADELKAVNDVLAQVGTLATQFFSGDIAQAFASAATLGLDPSAIAAVSVNLSESLRVSLAGAGVGTPSDGAAPTAIPATARAAPAMGDASGTGAAIGTAVADAQVPDAASAAAGEPVAATAPADAANAIGSLLDYLGRVLDALGTTTTSGAVTFSAKAKIQLLVGAIDAAQIEPREAAASAYLKRILAATTGSPAAPAAAA